MRSAIRKPFTSVLALAAIAGLPTLIAPAQGSAAKRVDRPADPVVLSGADASPLLGTKPERIVAFRRARKGWRQVPVQVDERHTVNLRRVYDETRKGIEIEAYSDPATLTGPDPDPVLDRNDEIATMARLGGAKAKRDGRGRIRRPAGTRRKGAVRLAMRDPRNERRSWLYLFRGTPRLDQAAGRDLVSYSFDLLAGDYPEAFDFRNGPNPERSIVATRHYRLSFSDRWINDLLEVRAGDSATVDLLDRRKVQFAPGVCGRSTDSFTAKHGAFVSNVDGPVRAIRSYVGANSGPMTQREHVFYDRREDSTTFLRVHQIRGVMDFVDYAPTPGTMTYRSSSFRGGVPIDGEPDAVPPAPPNWEQVSGPHGSLTHVGAVTSSAEGLELSSYRLDESDPDDDEEIQCTGDDVAWGASGLRVDGPIPNTDPLRSEDGEADRLEGLRTIFYDRPELPRRAAVKRYSWTKKPLELRSRAARTRPRG